MSDFMLKRSLLLAPLNPGQSFFPHEMSVPAGSSEVEQSSWVTSICHGIWAVTHSMETVPGLLSP